MRMVREPLGFPTSWTTSTNKRPPKTWLGRPPCEANLGDFTHNNRKPIHRRLCGLAGQCGRRKKTSIERQDALFG